MAEPIFIHSLFRSGSTYLFNVFRRSEHGYWCYQEPENEFLIQLNGDAENLLEMAGETILNLRHPVLSKPYFWEFHQIKDALAGLFRKSFSFDDFFAETAQSLSEDQHRYFSALIAHAKGRPVLQFCRSAGRISALKQSFGGIHIHLWREPRNQWWSFKVNNYFDPAVQLIYNAGGLPPVLDETRRRCGIVEFHSDDTLKEFGHARKHPLEATTNYFAFYALWLYAYLEGEKHADVTINIDKLSVDETYRATTLQSLVLSGIDGLDFSDCAMPRSIFSEDEVGFFTKIEHQVQGLFLLHSYNKFNVDQASAVHEHALLMGKGGQADLLRDAARAREMTLRYLDQFAHAEAQAQQAEARAAHAEAQAQQAEARATHAEAQAQQAEARATHAEARATHAEAQAQQAEAQAQQAEARAAHAEAQAQQAEARATHAEAKVQQLQGRLIAVHQSTSWYVTKPLRAVKRLLGGDFLPIRQVIQAAELLAKKTLRPPLAVLIKYFFDDEKMRASLNPWVKLIPWLHERLLRVGVNTGVVPPLAHNSATPPQPDQRQEASFPEGLPNLSPRAQRIYLNLKAAIDHRNKENG